METLFSKNIVIDNVLRTVTIKAGDIRDEKSQYDLLLLSAFVGGYTPTPSSLMGKLFQMGIFVGELAKHPALSISYDGFRFFVSEPIDSPICQRVGCLELMDHLNDYDAKRRFNAKPPFGFLEAALSYDYGLNIHSIALPLFGTGNMGLPLSSILLPEVEAVYRSLKKNPLLTEVTFFGYATEDMRMLEKTIEKTILANETDVFISYSSVQRNVALTLEEKLVSAGKKVWLDKHSIGAGASFGEEIIKGIENSTIFVLLLTPESSDSINVLNELITAMDKRKYVIPYQIGDFPLNTKFAYHLASTQRIFDKEKDLDSLVDIVIKKVDGDQ